MVFPSESMSIEVVRTPGSPDDLNSGGLGVVSLTRSHSLLRALPAASPAASESPGTVVVTFAELDDGVAEFFELHAASSRQLARVTRDNFFTVTFFTGPLLFERYFAD